jgi:hypothetical protein
VNFFCENAPTPWRIGRCLYHLNVFDAEAKETALYWAAQSWHEAVVRLLLEHGIGVNVETGDNAVLAYPNWA